MAFVLSPNMKNYTRCTREYRQEKIHFSDVLLSYCCLCLIGSFHTYSIYNIIIITESYIFNHIFF